MDSTARWARGSAGSQESAILTKLVAVTVLFALGVGGFAGYSEWKFREHGETLAAEIATYKLQHWERPALRGTAGDGNAAFDEVQALAGFSGLTPQQRETLALHVHYNEPLAAESLALLEQHEALVDKLRAATLLSRAMTETPFAAGEASTVPSYPRVVDAALLLLARGALAGPDECLLACADSVRLGQDLVPGASIEAASVAARIASITSPLLTRCASLASHEALSRAAREFHLLALNPAPTFGSIELADLQAKQRLMQLSTLFGGSENETVLARLRRRPALFAALEYFARPTRWRELSPASYPQALQSWLREHEWRSRAELALVPESTADVDGWLLDDMRGQALVRAMAVGLATVTERARRKRLPKEPVSLLEPKLFDPYNGLPLKWRVAQDGSELSLWSVGEDLRDDKGSSDWTPQAPVDVVVHFRLRPLEDGDATKRAAKR